MPNSTPISPRQSISVSLNVVNLKKQLEEQIGIRLSWDMVVLNGVASLRDNTETLLRGKVMTIPAPAETKKVLQPPDPEKIQAPSDLPKPAEKPVDNLPM